MERISGFTLLELIVVLAIAAIILSSAIPAYSAFVQNSRIDTVSNDYIRSLNYARSEAVKSGIRTTVCIRDDNEHCATHGNWNQGWLVFRDSNENAVREAHEILLKVRGPLTPDQTLTGNAPVKKYVSFAPTGFTQRISGGLQMGTLILCDRRGFEFANAIVINRTGRVRQSKASKTNKSNCNAR